ncbi:hypothetical protein ACOME3_004329 [Neoechinorhynchus agilis]
MTYMFEPPIYKKIEIESCLDEKQFERYGLFEYCEGIQCHQPEGKVPMGVLFVTGNADSYKQVRSLASVSLRYFEDKYERYSMPTRQMPRFYSIDFDEQLSGLCGEYLFNQMMFLNQCLKYLSQRHRSALIDFEG